MTQSVRLARGVAKLLVRAGAARRGSSTEDDRSNQQARKEMESSRRLVEFQWERRLDGLVEMVLTWLKRHGDQRLERDDRLVRELCAQQLRRSRTVVSHDMVEKLGVQAQMCFSLKPVVVEASPTVERENRFEHEKADCPRGPSNTTEVRNEYALIAKHRDMLYERELIERREEERRRKVDYGKQLMELKHQQELQSRWQKEQELLHGAKIMEDVSEWRKEEAERRNQERIRKAQIARALFQFKQEKHQQQRIAFEENRRQELEVLEHEKCLEKEALEQEIAKRAKLCREAQLDREILAQQLARNEHERKLELERDVHFAREQERVLEERDRQRMEELAKISKRQQALETLGDHTKEQQLRKEKQLQQRVEQYQREKQRLEQEQEQAKRERRMVALAETKVALGRQMAERLQAKELKRAQEEQYALQVQNRYSMAETQDRVRRERLNENRMRYCRDLQQQIQEQELARRENRFRDGMNDTELAMNRSLLAQVISNERINCCKT